MSIWDDPDLRAGGEFVKLENVGDRVEGQILAVRSHKFDDGSTAPQIIFQCATSGEERTWTAGQIQAKRKLAELRPEAGDYIVAVLANVEKRSGGKTLKHIEIEVRRGGQAVAAPATAAVAQPAPVAAPVAAPAYAQPAPAVAAPAAVAAPVAAAPVARQRPPAPAGIDPNAWAAMPDDQVQGILAAMGLPPF